MDAQTIFNIYINEAKVFSNERIKLQKEHLSLFENKTDIQDVKNTISSMNDDNLKKYFMTSQISLDTQTIFNKINSFIDFCNKLSIELNTDSITEVIGLPEYISNTDTFTTDYIVKENTIVEKDTKMSTMKFSEFKKSLPKFINVM